MNILKWSKVSISQQICLLLSCFYGFVAKFKILVLFWGNLLKQLFVVVLVGVESLSEPEYSWKTINNHSGNKDEQLQFSQKPDMDYKVEQVEDLIFLLHYILETEMLEFIVL